MIGAFTKDFHCSASLSTSSESFKTAVLLTMHESDLHPFCASCCCNQSDIQMDVTDDAGLLRRNSRELEGVFVLNVMNDLKQACALRTVHTSSFEIERCDCTNGDGEECQCICGNAIAEM